MDCLTFCLDEKAFAASLVRENDKTQHYPCDHRPHLTYTEALTCYSYDDNVYFQTLYGLYFIEAYKNNTTFTAKTNQLKFY